MVLEKEVIVKQNFDLSRFVEALHCFEQEEHAHLVQEGWHLKEIARRHVMFIFGDIELMRRCYEKEGQRFYPVDEFLDLEPYSRYSKGLFHKLATMEEGLGCRTVAKLFQEKLHLKVSKDVVMKARQKFPKTEKNAISFYEDEALLEKLEQYGVNQQDK